MAEEALSAEMRVGQPCVTGPICSASLLALSVVVTVSVPKMIINENG